MTRSAFSVILVLCILAPLCIASRTPDVADVRKALDGSLAKVAFYLKYDDGEAPGGSGAGYPAFWRMTGRAHMQGSASNIDFREPVVSPGFVIATDTILVEDPMVDDRFIDRIEVEIGSAKYPATIEAMALDNRALFLKLPARAGTAKPIIFDSKASPPYSAVTYAQGSDGAWGIQLVPVTGDAGITDDGARPMHVPSPALIVNSKGRIAGAAFTGVISPSGGWKGSPVLWKKMTAEDFRAKADAIAKAAGSGIVQVTIKFRIKQSRRWDDSSYWEQRDTPTEKDVPGLLLGGGKALLLTGLSRRQTATVDSAAITLGEKSVPLAIEGALVSYGALLATYDKENADLKPLAMSRVDFARMLDRLLVADELSYACGARYERIKRGRISGVSPGPLGFMWPESDNEGQFLFALDGTLVAVPLGLRPQVQMAEYYTGGDDGDYYSTVTTPVERLTQLTADPSAVDPSWRPLTEDESNRFAWLGIETQDITRDLARAKDAAVATRGGEIGVLVSHVYKGSPAEKTEVKPGDVLVRFAVEGQVKPVDVKMNEQSDNDFPWAELDQVPEAYFDQIPRPWPSQNNILAKTLTEVGIGRRIKAEFVRDGRTRLVDFVLEYGPPDFNSAASFEDKASGLTVKDLTYEVRRYFKMKDDDPGVVVSGIKKGSRASVGGVKPCEIVTAVNGKAISGIEDFKAGVAVGGEVSLTVKRMSQTRVVKLKLPGPSQGKKGEAGSHPSTPDESPVGSSESALANEASEAAETIEAPQEAQPAE